MSAELDDKRNLLEKTEARHAAEIANLKETNERLAAEVRNAADCKIALGHETLTVTVKEGVPGNKSVAVNR